jgi:hypothetical protein
MEKNEKLKIMLLSSQLLKITPKKSTLQEYI